jgi:hypothetical protein
MNSTLVGAIVLAEEMSGGLGDVEVTCSPNVDAIMHIIFRRGMA